MELLGEGGEEDGEGHGQAAHHRRQPGRLPPAKVEVVQPGFKMDTTSLCPVVCSILKEKTPVFEALL